MKKQPKNFRISRRAMRCLEELKNTAEFETETQIIETGILHLWFEFREQGILKEVEK